MRAGAHAQALPDALSGCDLAYVMIYPDMDWDKSIKQKLATQCKVLDSVDSLLAQLQNDLKPNDQVVFMSIGSFDSVPRRFRTILSS